MTDVATISTFLGSIKTATDIAKAIRSANVTLEKAEIKLRMAELIESLAEAKIQAAEIQDILQEKDRRIVDLEHAFELKSKLVRKKNAYYELNENGDPVGDAYCSYCWEVNHRTVHLNYSVGMNQRNCPSCKTDYDWGQTQL